MLKKKRVPIVFEDDAVIVCEKPAGMPVQSDHTRDMDMLTILKHHIFEEQNSEEEPYLAVVHRLDRPVGGLMVLAAEEVIRNRKAEVLFLPAYSPDLNPIEKMWSKVKQLLRGIRAKTAEEI